MLLQALPAGRIVWAEAAEPEQILCEPLHRVPRLERWIDLRRPRLGRPGDDAPSSAKLPRLRPEPPQLPEGPRRVGSRTRRIDAVERVRLALARDVESRGRL